MRAQYCKNISIKFINTKLQSFAMLQQQLNKKNILYYYNSKRQIFIDVDKFKKYKFEIYIYYVRNDFAIYFFQTINI